MLPLSWNLTNHVRDYQEGATTYISSTISISKISQSDEIAKSDLTITVPRDSAIAERFRIIPPAEPMTIVVKRAQFGTAGFIIVWQGRVVSVSWSGAEAVITCEPIYSTIRRPGFSRYYSNVCGHSLYGPKCRVIAELYKETAMVTSVSGINLVVIKAAEKPNGYYNGGYIEYLTDEGILEQRLIMTHVTSALSLSAAPSRLEGGKEIDFFPGCNHTINVCQSKFSNQENYGGFPYIPTTGTPFAGKTIF